MELDQALVVVDAADDSLRMIRSIQEPEQKLSAGIKELTTRF
jgi:hypothetical protein